MGSYGVPCDITHIKHLNVGDSADWNRGPRLGSWREICPEASKDLRSHRSTSSLLTVDKNIRVLYYICYHIQDIQDIHKLWGCHSNHRLCHRPFVTNALDWDKVSVNMAQWSLVCLSPHILDLTGRRYKRQGHVPRLDCMTEARTWKMSDYSNRSYPVGLWGGKCKTGSSLLLVTYWVHLQAQTNRITNYHCNLDGQIAKTVNLFFCVMQLIKFNRGTDRWRNCQMPYDIQSRNMLYGVQ